MDRRTAGTRGSDDWVERVRAASDIAEIVGQSVALKRVGRNWMGLCPFHQEKTPSFSVNAERQFYHCFSCKAGGDVFTFVQETERVGFLEAAEMLSRRAGIPVPERRGGLPQGQKAKLTAALEAAATAYEQWLADPQWGAKPRAYLESRGLTRETIRAFRLGVAPAGWEHLAGRLAERHGEATLIEAGLAMRREGGKTGVYDRFRNRLMVPLVAPGGAVVGFGARALAADDAPKYLNSPETPVYHKGSFLFALEQARRASDPDGEMIVVEGYFDAIALHQAGLANTVATSGTALTPEQARLLRRMVARVALTYDGDAAGQDAMLRSLGVLLAEGLDVAVVTLPAGDDPDTLMRRDGVAGWQAARAAAADPVEFVQRHVLRAKGAGDPRERALQAVVGLGATLADPIRLSLLAERAERVLGIAPAVVQRAVALRRAGRTADKPLGEVVARERTQESHWERAVMRYLLAHPASLAAAREAIEPGDFRDTACAELARALWEGDGTVPAAGEPGALARELTSTLDAGSDWEAEATGYLRRMRIRKLRFAYRQAELSLKRATDSDEAARVMTTIQNIARTLKELSEVQGD